MSNHSKCQTAQEVALSNIAASRDTVNLHPLVTADQIARMCQHRRYLHQYPELSFQEFKTAEFIANELRSYGIQVFEKVGRTGVVGILTGTKTGITTSTPIDGSTVTRPACLAFRADMDALPIDEIDSDMNKLYKSQTPNVMHACGHDGHISILLTVARILSTKRDSFNGTIKFVFQPAEEGLGGAREMIKDGVLEEKFGPRVDQIYGLHVWNYLGYGKVGVKFGPLMAASDKFLIHVHGKGGHGAVPDGTHDAIIAGAQLVTALQTIVSRNVSPLDSAVISIGQLNGGYNYNIIADKVDIVGTVRTFTPHVQQTVETRMKEICAGIGAMFNVKVECEYQYGYPCTVNRSRPHVQLVAAATEAVVGSNGVIECESTMCAEDMSYFLDQRDGCFFFVGSSPSEKEVVPHHKSIFDLDERCMSVGASIFLNLVDRLMS